MNVSDILTRVQRTFGDEAGVQITNDDIIRWINDGVRTVLTNNEQLLQAIGYADSVAGQQDYNLPTNCLILQKILYKSSSDSSYFKIKYLSLQDMDEYVDGYSGAVSVSAFPQIYTIYADKITLFPVPSTSDSQALKIYYNRSPVDVVNSTDVPDLPIIYHSSIVDYCLKQAYELDEDVDATALKDKEFVDGVKLLKGRDEWKNQETYPVITVRAEDESYF